MKTVMRDVVERLAVVKRVQKRGAITRDECGVPAKTKKLFLHTNKDKLHTWWCRGSAKPILRPRA